MDQRRLSTADVLAAGIINQQSPTTDIPHDRDTYDGDSFSKGEVIAALEAGLLVESANYYGIPHVWKDDMGEYQGRLLQYRAVTESHSFSTANDAAEWFMETHIATNG